MERAVSTEDLVIVDDDEMAIALVSRHLKDSRYSCRCFSLPDKAIRFLSANQPKILLVDYMMPKMDGLELIKSIYPTQNGGVPVIYLCSSVELPGDVQRFARKCGATPRLKEQLMTKESIEELFVNLNRNPCGVDRRLP